MNHPEEIPPSQVRIDSGPLKLALGIIAITITVLLVCYFV